MRKELTPVDLAVGKVVCHDLTMIRGSIKKPLFKKGHIITYTDISELKKIGKEHIYTLELENSEIHEDEAGTRLGKAAAGRNVRISDPLESRVNLIATRKGLLKINTGLLEQVNNLPDTIVVTLPGNTIVEDGQILAGTKIIPLAISEEIILEAERLMVKDDLAQVLPFSQKQVGLIITGREILEKRVEDGFKSVIEAKISFFDSQVMATKFVTDDPVVISREIHNFLDIGADLIVITGGMSVDPDDVSPLGIAMAGAKLECYGAPVLPGAMFLLAYLGNVPVLGVPACGMFFKITILHLLLPRIFAGEKVTKQDILSLAQGGLCRACPVCHFPACSFGLGGGL